MGQKRLPTKWLCCIDVSLTMAKSKEALLTIEKLNLRQGFASKNYA